MSIPFFAMYPTDFDAKTAHLTLAEDGAYNRLLRLQWTAPGCKLPADLPWIMRKMRAVTEADQAIVAGIIGEFFTRKGGKIFNDRLLKEWGKAVAAHEKKVSAGLKGATAKALKQKQTEESTAKADLKQPEPEPEPEPDKKKEQCSVAKATGETGSPAGDPPPEIDVAKLVFDAGVRLLTRAGTPEPKARAFLGKLRRDNTDAAIFEALTECNKAGAVDPIAWLTASLKARANSKNRQQINDEMMRRALAQI